MTEYKLIRSMRTTVAISISKDGNVVVRAPHSTSKAFIEGFVNSKRNWINETVDRMKERSTAKKALRLSEEQIRECKAKAKIFLTQRSEYYAEIMGVKYKEIKINSAHTRWGSCNAKGTINFAYRLILAPPQLADYVVVHELAHLIELNHSKRFWQIVGHFLPDYKERQKKLQEWQHGLDIL